MVGKEMYEFEDRGGRTLALRPEGTAPMVRAFVQHRPPLPWKAWYATPAFRYERPQAGRYRQHHQLGVEALGPRRPRPRRGGGLAGRRLLPLPGPDRRSSSGSTRWATRCAVPATSSSCGPTWPSAATSSAPSTASGSTPTRCGPSTASAPSAGRPPPTPRALVDHLCDPCRAALRPGPRRPRRPGRALPARPPPGPRVRLLHPDHLRVLVGGAGVGPERHRRRRAATTGWWRCSGGPPTPGIGFGIGIERLLLACDAEGVFPVDPPPLDAFVVDVAGGESARDLTAELRAGRPAGRPGLRRPLDEVPAEVGRPVGGPGGADRGTRRDGGGHGVPATHCGEPGSSAPCPRSEVVEAVRAEAGRRRPVDPPS